MSPRKPKLPELPPPPPVRYICIVCRKNERPSQARKQCLECQPEEKEVPNEQVTN